MARINFDDDVESQPEFRRLLPLVGGDWDLALGKLVRFFRLAQSKYGQGLTISESELVGDGLGVMIESGWAIKSGDGYQAKGASDYFAWYLQKCGAGRKRAESDRDENGRFKSSGTPAEHQRQPAAHQPLAPALVPVLALSKNKEEEKKVFVESPSAPPNPKKDEFDIAKAQWLKTLAHFKAPRGELLPHEEREIWRALKANNLVTVCNALAGMRLEKATERFNPADHLDIYRAFKPDRMGVFINLAVQETERRSKLRAPPPPQLHSLSSIGSIMQGITSGVTA